jgi:hypothetical protein
MGDTATQKKMARERFITKTVEYYTIPLPSILAPDRAKVEGVTGNGNTLMWLRALEAFAHAGLWIALMITMLNMNDTIKTWRDAAGGTLERSMGEAAAPYFVVAFGSLWASVAILGLVALAEAATIRSSNRKGREESDVIEPYWICFFGEFVRAGLRCVTVFVIIASVLAVDAQDVAHAEYRAQSAASIVLAIALSHHLDGVLDVVKQSDRQ